MKHTARIAIGFTLVELITVILLLGVISAVAIARSGRASDFEPRQFASTAAEQYRFAHGLSSGRYGDPIRFSISASAGAWQFVSASIADGEVRREELVADTISLSITNGATTTSFGVGDLLHIDFSPTGDLAAAEINSTSLQTTLGIELTISGDSTQFLCIYPTGYVGTSACE